MLIRTLLLPNKYQDRFQHAAWKYSQEAAWYLNILSLLQNGFTETLMHKNILVLEDDIDQQRKPCAPALRRHAPLIYSHNFVSHNLEADGYAAFSY